MHAHSRSRARDGMTLVEVVMAMTIMVVGLFTVFDSLVTSQHVNDRATNQALAYQEIQAQIETVQYLPFVTVAQDFKGLSFAVKGLRVAVGSPSVGTVTNLANPNPEDTTLAPNPNLFPANATKLPLRFRAHWVDAEGDAIVEVVYILVYRGI